MISLYSNLIDTQLFSFLHYNIQYKQLNVFLHNSVEPPIIDPFRFPERKSGDRVMTSCTVSSGDLPINITWMRDGEQVREGSGVSTQVRSLIGGRGGMFR